MSWFCSHVSATARLLASTPVAESNESREWWLKSGFLSCVLQSCRSVIGQLLPRGHDFAFAASLSAVGYLPECAPVLVGAGGWRRPGAVSRFCPPLGGQAPAIVRPHWLIARLMPVNAIPARRDIWPLPVLYGRSLSAPIVGAHLRPKHQLEFIVPWCRRMPATLSGLAEKEHTRGATRWKRVLQARSTTAFAAYCPRSSPEP